MSKTLTTGPGVIQKVRWWHEQIVDIMLLFPHWSQGDIAIHFDVTEPWLSSVINSDIFQAYRQMRYKAHHAGITKGIADRVEGVAKASLDAIEKRIKEAGDELPLPILKETSEMALKALGFGSKHSNGHASPVQLNIGRVDNLSLEGRLKRLDAKKTEAPTPKIIEGKKIEEQLPLPLES